MTIIFYAKVVMILNKKIKLFLDFDGTIVNTIKAITSLYNEDFVAYKKYKYINWFDVNTWDFLELEATTPEYINHYFNQPRFFSKLEYMDNFIEVYKRLIEKYDITIVSSGYSPNLVLKEKWVLKNLPDCKFIGVNLKHHKNKSHIDMYRGVFIDDSFNNLATSNASRKICFGEIYEWNEKSTYDRCYNWTEVEKLLDKINWMLRLINQDYTE